MTDTNTPDPVRAAGDELAAALDSLLDGWRSLRPASRPAGFDRGVEAVQAWRSAAQAVDVPADLWEVDQHARQYAREFDWSHHLDDVPAVAWEDGYAAGRRAGPAVPDAETETALLASSDNVRAVCESQGLAAFRGVDGWSDDRVAVRIVNGEFGWQVQRRDGMGGTLVCEVGDFLPMPAAALVSAIKAARGGKR